MSEEKVASNTDADSSKTNKSTVPPILRVGDPYRYTAAKPDESRHERRERERYWNRIGALARNNGLPRNYYV